MGLISREPPRLHQARAGPRADILSGSLEDAMSIGRVSTIWSNKKRNARRYKNRTCVRAPATTNSSAFPAGPAPRHAPPGRTSRPHTCGTRRAGAGRTAQGAQGADGAGGTQTHTQPRATRGEPDHRTNAIHRSSYRPHGRACTSLKGESRLSRLFRHSAS